MVQCLVLVLELLALCLLENCWKIRTKSAITDTKETLHQQGWLLYWYEDRLLSNDEFCFRFLPDHCPPPPAHGYQPHQPYQPPVNGYQPQNVGYQPPVTGYQPQTVGYQPAQPGYQAPQPVHVYHPPPTNNYNPPPVSNYQPSNNYQPANSYQPSTSYQPSNSYQPASGYLAQKNTGFSRTSSYKATPAPFKFGVGKWVNMAAIYFLFITYLFYI